MPPIGTARVGSQIPCWTAIDKRATTMGPSVGDKHVCKINFGVFHDDRAVSVSSPQRDHDLSSDRGLGRSFQHHGSRSKVQRNLRPKSSLPSQFVPVGTLPTTKQKRHSRSPSKMHVIFCVKSDLHVFYKGFRSFADCTIELGNLCQLPHGAEHCGWRFF